MVVTKFVHLNSIYRDRTRNPYQSEFEIDIEGIFNDNIIDPTVDSFPINSGSCIAVSTNVLTITEANSNDANVNDYYKDMYIDNGDGNYIQIVKYYTNENSGSLDVAVLSATFPSGTYYIRQKIPLVSTTVGTIGNTTTTVSLVGVSSVSDVYKNNYIRLVISPTVVEIRKITSFNGTSLVATVETPFSTTPTVGLRVEIGVAKENVRHIRSDFSNTYTQYEIQLLSLILPINYDISGTSTVLDKYMSVSLNNVNNGYTVNTYSNNTINSNTLFLAYCVDTSRAWGVYSSNSVQTVRLNMSKSLKISIRTSDGQLLKYNLQDSKSPSPPIPLLQINALFSIKKIN
jgi:hypothetical protein